MNTNRNYFINCRVTKNERKSFERLAQQEGRTMSELMREIMREELERRGLPPVGLSGMLQELEAAH